MRQTLKIVYLCALFVTSFASIVIKVPFSTFIFSILTLFVVYVICLITIIYYESKKGWKLLETGRYDEAINFYSNAALQTKPPRDWPYLFAKAVAQHRKGALNEAIESLDGVMTKKLPAYCAPHYYALYARTLVMSGKEFDRADELHRLALGDGPIPVVLADALLFKCHQACLQNDLPQARALIAQYMDVIKNRTLKEKTFGMKFDWKYLDALEGYLLGHFYFKDGNLPEASKHLKRAVDYPYVDMYSTRARDLLASISQTH